MKKFWMVYLEGRNTPTIKHSTEESARQEAEKLTKTSGLDSYVLEIVGQCKKTPEVFWNGEEETKQIPF